MKLKEYLNLNAYSTSNFAMHIGIHQSTVSRLALGASKPSLDLMKRIARATRGQVMPNDFVDLSDVDGMSEGSSKELPSA